MSNKIVEDKQIKIEARKNQLGRVPGLWEEVVEFLIKEKIRKEKR